MSEVKSVSIDLIKGKLTDYIIRDVMGITIGRFTIVELDQENRKASIRLKFYREDNYNLLKDTLELILKAVLKEKYVHKVNVFVSETINISAFLNLGFVLEGIISDNLFVNGVHISELVFGINVYDFNEHSKIIQFQLKSKNIELRNLSPEYAQDMLDYYSRNEQYLRSFEPSRDKSFYSYETQRNILMESYKQFIDGSSLDLGIFKNNKIVGKIKLSNVVYGVFKSGFLGYSIDKDHQGKGYMKEAVNLLINYAFHDMGLHRLEASTLVDNIKSQRVLKSCGFKELGINEKYLYINGEWRDHITFYLINKEW